MSPRRLGLGSAGQRTYGIPLFLEIQLRYPFFHVLAIELRSVDDENSGRVLYLASEGLIFAHSSLAIRTSSGLATTNLRSPTSTSSRCANSVTLNSRDLPGIRKIDDVELVAFS